MTSRQLKQTNSINTGLCDETCLRVAQGRCLNMTKMRETNVRSLQKDKLILMLMTIIKHSKSNGNMIEFSFSTVHDQLRIGGHS